MRDMIIDTRPNPFHFDKLTLTIANKIKDRISPNLALGLSFSLNDQFDISVLLEDSKRNIMNSLFKDINIGNPGVLVYTIFYFF